MAETGRQRQTDVKRQRQGGRQTETEKEDQKEKNKLEHGETNRREETERDRERERQREGDRQTDRERSNRQHITMQKNSSRGRNCFQAKQQKYKCSNNPYSPHLQDFLTVILITQSTIMNISAALCNFIQHNDCTSSSLPITL